MIRAGALCGMTGGFLMISPKLRDLILGGFSKVSFQLNEYSPFSYIGLGLAVFAFITVSLYRNAPR